MVVMEILVGSEPGFEEFSSMVYRKQIEYRFLVLPRVGERVFLFGRCYWSTVSEVIWDADLLGVRIVLTPTRLNAG